MRGYGRATRDAAEGAGVLESGGVAAAAVDDAARPTRLGRMRRTFLDIFIIGATTTLAVAEHRRARAHGGVRVDGKVAALKPVHRRQAHHPVVAV